MGGTVMLVALRPALCAGLLGRVGGGEGSGELLLSALIAGVAAKIPGSQCVPLGDVGLGLENFMPDREVRSNEGALVW